MDGTKGWYEEGIVLTVVVRKNQQACYEPNRFESALVSNPLLDVMRDGMWSDGLGIEDFNLEVPAILLDVVQTAIYGLLQLCTAQAPV